MSKIKYAKIEKSAYDVANLAFTLGKHCEQAIEDNKKTDSKYL